MDRDRVVIYTDGACRNNPGTGGWAALLRYEYKNAEKIIKGAEPNTTNNRMELKAAVAGLSVLKRRCKVILVTDSKYLCDGASRWMVAWKSRSWHTSNGKAVKNRDLWESLDSLMEKHVVSWRWVKAHNGHVENELVDRVANEAIDEFLF